LEIIGREYEKKQLQKAYDSPEAAFVAVYGRRRVGKTYLIREFFKGKKGFFVTVQTPIRLKSPTNFMA
jgi:AAA+ ATPase superfamily predicted ATPase